MAVEVFDVVVVAVVLNEMFLALIFASPAKVLADVLVLVGLFRDWFLI